MRGNGRVKFSLFISLCLFMTLAACGDKQDPVQVSVSGGGGVVTYSSDIKPLLENNCLRCHSRSVSGAARNGAPVDVNFDTYADIFALADRANPRIQSGTMPPTGPLSDQQKALFQRWIDGGKLENAPSLTAMVSRAIDFGDYKTWEIVDSVAFPANLSILGEAHQGNNPEYTRWVYANARKTGDSYAVGSMFVQETFTWENNKKKYAVSGGLLAMVKTGGSFNPEGDGWEWAELNPESRDIIARGGADMGNGACNSCHGSAVNYPGGEDFVFPYPDDPFAGLPEAGAEISTLDQ